MGLNSKYSKDKWGFIAMEQGEGVSGWKFINGRHRGQGDFEARDLDVKDGG